MCMKCDIAAKLEAATIGAPDRDFIVRRVNLLLGVVDLARSVSNDVLNGRPLSRDKVETLHMLSQWSIDNEESQVLHACEYVESHSEPDESDALAAALAAILGRNIDPALQDALKRATVIKVDGTKGLDELFAALFGDDKSPKH